MTKGLARAFAERLQRLVADGETQPDLAFRGSLAAAVLHHGQSLRAVAERTSVQPAVLQRVLNGERRPSEQTVRKLAPFVDLTPDAAAAMAGYTNVAVFADIRAFESVQAWLVATRELRHESTRHFALGAGVAETSIRAIERGAFAERPTLDKIADYVHVDRAELRALRGKNPNKVAHSTKVVAGMEREQPGRMSELSKRGRAKIDYHAARADRVDGGRTGAVVALRHRDEYHWGVFLAAGIDAENKRREDGRKQIGHSVVCVLCGNPDSPLWQKPSQRDRGDGQQRQHTDCFHQWLKRTEVRELYRSLTLIWMLVREAGSKTLRDRIRVQLRAERNYLRGHHRGRRPSLLDDVALANEVAVLRLDQGLSPPEIQHRFGWAPRRDVRGNKSTSRQLQEMLALGYLLRCPWPR